LTVLSLFAVFDCLGDMLLIGVCMYLDCLGKTYYSLGGVLVVFYHLGVFSMLGLGRDTVMVLFSVLSVFVIFDRLVRYAHWVCCHVLVLTWMCLGRIIPFWSILHCMLRVKS
jgi:hypothetical protein